MSGHATTEEEALIRALEERAQSGRASLEDLLDLGCLFIEPLHDAERAIACFEDVLRTHASCSIAKIWIAYCHLQYSMDQDSLDAGQRLLDEVIATDPEQKAPALLVSAEIGELSGELSKEEVILRLEASVTAAPDWIDNRRFLATRYAAVGRRREADEQLAQALQNVVPEGEDWPPRRRLFEMYITGRTAFRAVEDLEELRRRYRE